jgi:hypothetical protein
LYNRLLETRLQLRAMGEETGDMIVFSFWPDVIMIKEIGDPLRVARHLQLDRKELQARVIMAQGRQNTNYAINLYACHPFFIQGYSTMTNGENTAFIPIREYLEIRGFPGYTGYQSDSEVFTHILHYTTRNWGWGSSPTSTSSPRFRTGICTQHPNPASAETAQADLPQADHRRTQLRHRLLPDHSLFMVQDRKKAAPRCGGRPPRALRLFVGNCAAWMPPSPSGTNAKIFNPCIWTPPLSDRIARRLRYATRRTHCTFLTEHQGFALADSHGIKTNARSVAAARPVARSMPLSWGSSANAPGGAGRGIPTPENQ